MYYFFQIRTSVAAAVLVASTCMAATPDLPSCDSWAPACSGNYTNSSRPSSSSINYVVIHKVQGTAASAASWFQNCSAGVSAHYIFNNSTGYCYQSVLEEDIAYQVSGFNTNCIGIEHGGYNGSNDTATACYDASAIETRSCIDYYGVPYDRQHILGHSECPGCSTGNGGGTTCHTDPGPYWNWTYYFAKCQQSSGTSAGASGVDACSWGTGRIDTFVRGTGNDLRHQWYVSGEGWSAWQSLGGTISGDPSAVSWGVGRIDVFAKGGGNSIYHKWYDGGNWSAWENLGGSFVGSPDACSYTAGRLDVFARGTDNHIYQRYYNSGSGWAAWVDQGGILNSDPTAVSWGDGRIDIFARGGGNAIYQKYWSSGTGWSAWVSQGGTCASGPDACSWAPGRIDYFVLGGGNAVFHKSFTSGVGWSVYDSLGGIGAGDPGCCSWGSGRLDVFVRGGGDDIYHKYYDNGAWQSPGWQNLQH
jgi:hypothetical protein